MAPTEKTTPEKAPLNPAKAWTPSVDVDMLLLLIINSGCVSGHKWEVIAKQMEALGFEFSASGVRQRFQTRLMRPFKAKCQEKKLGLPDGESPSKKKVSGTDTEHQNGENPPQATPPKAKRGRTPKAKAGNQDGEEGVEGTPTKKPRGSRGNKVKAEPQDDNDCGTGDNHGQADTGLEDIKSKQESEDWILTGG